MLVFIRRPVNKVVFIKYLKKIQNKPNASTILRANLQIRSLQLYLYTTQGPYKSRSMVVVAKNHLNRKNLA